MQLKIKYNFPTLDKIKEHQYDEVKSFPILWINGGYYRVYLGNDLPDNTMSFDYVLEGSVKVCCYFAINKKGYNFMIKYAKQLINQHIEGVVYE